MLKKERCFAKPAAAILVKVLLFMFPAAGGAQSGALMHANTLANNAKSNQSRVWFYDGKWWAIAPHAQTKTDYIWRYNPANSIWTRTAAKLDSGAYNRYDAHLETAAGELAVLRSHSIDTKFYRFNYTAGDWVIIVEKTLANFGNLDNGNPCSLTKAKNGDFWIFRIDAGRLQVRKSNNGGAAWTGATTIKSNLNATRGTTGAITFSQGSASSSADESFAAATTGDFVGVAYGELGANGVNSAYGFLYHRDGDPLTVWTDESHLLTFAGSEKGYNQLSLAVDPQNRLYLFTRNFAGVSLDPRNTLYKRPGPGFWKRITVNTFAGKNWNDPVVAIDTSNSLLIVAGIRSDSGFAEYKSAPLNSEPALEIARRNVLLAHGNDDFQHLNAPRQWLNRNDGMLVTAGNVTAQRTWFKRVIKSNIFPIRVDTVQAASQEVNAPGDYKIVLALTDKIAGALAAGNGKIFIKFSPTAAVPDEIFSGHVRVNGIPASAVSTVPLSRRIMITTPINLVGGATVPVEIDSAAGVINARNAGPDSLQAWTSSQTTMVSSSVFQLLPATTKVSAVRVQPNPNEPGEAADYTIGFRLGPHGRMFAGQDTFYLQFPAKTSITNGALAGVYVNEVSAAAHGDNAAHVINIIVPGGLKLNNQDSVTLFLPTAALQNPATVGKYTLHVSTSVERTKSFSKPYQIGVICGAPIAGTAGDFTRGNQSKTFYHAGKWWLAAQASDDHDWYLWKNDGVNWEQKILIHNASKVRPDVWLNANKLYILFPGGSTTEFARLTFSGGNWSMDNGYPKAVNQVQKDEMNLVRARNGNWWVFWIADSALHAQRSNNDGASWFPPVIVKYPLHAPRGLADAVPFTVNGADAIGLGYAENGSNQNTKFGFLYHRDSDPNGIWSDESGKLITPLGTSADNHIHLGVYDDQIFMVFKTKGDGANVTKNGMYLRRTNNRWSRYDIIQGNGWTRPVLALDVTNLVFYAFGVREGDDRYVEMKRVPMGQYGSLLTSPPETVLCYSNEAFFDISMPPHNVNAAMDLMLVAENETRDGLWQRRLNLTPLTKTGNEAEEQAPVIADQPENFAVAAEVYPNPFNPRTTIRFRVHEAASVQLQIFNINGQIVRTLVDGNLSAGLHWRDWNARNHAGEPAASGTYLYRLRIGERVATGSMQLLK